MTATLFTRCGQALYGADAWHTKLATHLDVDPRNVQRWAAGSHEVPSGVWRDLRYLLDSRRRMLDGVIEEVELNR